MQREQKLYILEDIDNPNIIKFFLMESYTNTDFSKIEEYKEITYTEPYLYKETNFMPGGYYHCIDFNLSSIKDEIVKNKIKDFIKDVFKETVEDEESFINLLKKLSEFFSKKKDSSEKKFIQNVFSFLLFLNYCLDEKLISNDFLITRYNNDNKFNELQLDNVLNLNVKYSKNLSIEYDPNNNLVDCVSAIVKFEKGQQIDALAMIKILENKGLNTNNDVFISLKEGLISIDPDIIKEVTLKDTNDIVFLYFDNIDRPDIEITNMKKCKQIFYKMNYSYSTYFDKNEFNNKILSLSEKQE